MIIGVIQHLFISTAFGFAIATVVFLVKGQRAATRYRLWLMAALKFAVPTIVFTSLGDWLHRAWVPERLFADWVVNFPTAPLMGHSDLLLPSGPIVSYETAWATLTGIWCLGAFCPTRALYRAGNSPILPSARAWSVSVGENDLSSGEFSLFSTSGMMKG
jgi:hypothetical protein